MSEQQQSQQENQGPYLVLQRIYLKDLSFETPGAPGVFQTNWKPDVKLDLNMSSKHLEQDVHEVVLSLTVTVSYEEKVTFILELKQAGIFSIQGFPEDQLRHLLGTYCPTVLYPYAREVVTDVVSRGSFPQLLLAPVNFEALFAQHIQQQEQEQAGGNTTKQ